MHTEYALCKLLIHVMLHNLCTFHILPLRALIGCGHPRRGCSVKRGSFFFRRLPALPGQSELAVPDPYSRGRFLIGRRVD